MPAVYTYQYFKHDSYKHDSYQLIGSTLHIAVEPLPWSVANLQAFRLDTSIISFYFSEQNRDPSPIVATVFLSTSNCSLAASFICTKPSPL